ncbi:hypothetical protein PT974_11135 [Cladobotryum mycophilum]|uniref:Anaphase-promoting complex subunit 4 WD40 domain-containing protein n=1 Tax=Cladobotryum mycophilum TaxID=491253 RepID=A0ABR0S5D3_9HYPO
MTWDNERGLRMIRRGHHLDQVAISPDGSWTATALDNATILVGESDNDDYLMIPTPTRLGPGTALSTVIGGLVGTFAENGKISSIALSSDSQLIYLAIGDSEEFGRQIIARDIRTGGCLSRIETPGRSKLVLSNDGHWPRSLAISPDNQWVATGGFNGVIKIFDTSRYAAESEDTDRTFGMRMNISADGNIAASVGEWGNLNLEIWSTANGECLKTIPAEKLKDIDVRTMDVSPNGKWIAIISKHRDEHEYAASIWAIFGDSIDTS